ncbi:MAG TPA: protein kinase, partial [Planctomycetota bacterium]|nr:protein kinase [Planctomycetota bacterium]
MRGDVVAERVARLRRTDPAPPQRLGRYVLGERIGVGGMGAVYAAVHEATGAPAAVKVAPSTAPEASRLIHEARALGDVDHPSVVKVYDCGEEGGFAWTAVQKIVGRTLQQEIAERWAGSDGVFRLDGDAAAAPEPTPPSNAEVRVYVGWWRDLSRAFAAMHRAGVVHRDVKPANLMIDARGA